MLARKLHKLQKVQEAPSKIYRRVPAKKCRTALEGATNSVSGCFDGDIMDTAWYTNMSGDLQPDPRFYCNAGETDNRLWLHVTKTLYAYHFKGY